MQLPEYITKAEVHRVPRRAWHPRLDHPYHRPGQRWTRPAREHPGRSRRAKRPG